MTAAATLTLTAASFLLTQPAISAATGVANLTLQITNAGTGSQTYECDVTVTIEGSDYVVSELV